MNDEPIFENAYVAMKEVGNKWVAIVCVEDKTNKTEPNKNYNKARFATEFRYIDGSIVGGVVAIFTYSMFSIIVIGADAVRHTNDR